MVSASIGHLLDRKSFKAFAYLQGNAFDKYMGKNLDQIEIANEVEEGGTDNDEDVNVGHC